MTMVDEQTQAFQEQQAAHKLEEPEVKKVIYNSHPLHFKNALKLQLTGDLEVPFEARQSHQMLLTVSKQVNRTTG